jgi:hypothetical protein
MQATTDRPRFRQDLVAEPIEDGATRFIDVQDPDSGVLFRFFEVEYSLACAMDGQRDVAGIVKWAEEELGLKASANEVRNVISTLGDLGYLESGAAVAATAPAAAAKPAAAGRWDQPTAMGTADEYLEKGVVHGGGRAHTPAPDVELGTPGARPAAQAADMPRAADLELGAPGVVAAAATAKASTKVEDISLGKPGRSENIETDLAADMPLSAAAVKEAVRQSQVMKAVDIPPELAAELEKPAAKVEAKPAAKVEEKPAAKAEEKKPAAKVEEKKPAAKAEEKKPAAKAEEKKPAAKVEEKKPVAQPPVESKAPEAPSGLSPMLLAALVIAILAGGGFALWKFVINKKDTAETTGKAVTPPPQPEPPPPPPVETAKLATEAPPAEEVKPSAEGRVATIVANDTAVKEGDSIARLVGFQPLAAQVAAIDKALAKAKDDVAAAEKERDAAQVAGNQNVVASAEKKLTNGQKKVTEQEEKLATAKAALDKYLIKSPAAGKVTAVAKANAKVTPTDVIATVTREPTVVATFKSAGQVAVGTRVLLAIKDSEQKLSCTVAQAGGDGVKIACPQGAAADGTEVTYAGVDPNAPAPGETAPSPAPAPAEAGSAAAPPAEETPPAPPAEEKKAEEKAEKKTRRPRPRPAPPADKPADPAAPPAEPAPAPAPAPALAPAPAGSGT